MKSVHDNFYVDDYLMSVPDEETAISHVREIRRLLSSGGFRLHKWMSTSKQVLATIEQSERAGAVKEINNDTELPQERALGVHWNVQTDAFVFNIDLKEKASLVKVTRRTILSIAASLFDPLGFLAPITLIPKLIMQELCRSKLDWDDPAPQNLTNRWEEWLKEMPLLSSTEITRCLKPENLDREMTSELHFFADASETAYGAVCYLKVGAPHKFKVSFIIGKARLAPIKLITIPRLELCAAVLAARLAELVRRELRLSVNTTYFWTDSMTVLRYIQNTTSRYKTFVANRLGTIHDLTDVAQWHFIEGTINPADLASRGFMPSEKNKLKTWLSGPTFLQTSKYPDSTSLEHPSALQDTEDHDLVMTTAEKHQFLDSILERCGSWNKVKESTRLVLRFVEIIARRPVEVDEESIIVRRIQEASFDEDYARLKKGKEISAASKLVQLNPFVDEKGVIRIRGRIANSKLHSEGDELP